MRFSITATSLTIISFVAGTIADSASNITYTPRWGAQVSSYGQLGPGAPDVFIDNGEIYMRYISNGVTYSPLRFEFVEVTNNLGQPTTAAKLVEYPGYDLDLYMSQPAGGNIIYSTFDASSAGLGSWGIESGPSNDPQFRLTLGGSKAAKVLWDASKSMYKIYIGPNMPSIEGMVSVDVKVTQYCGPDYTGCE